jgi:hypothetical protein
MAAQPFLPQIAAYAQPNVVLNYNANYHRRNGDSIIQQLDTIWREYTNWTRNPQGFANAPAMLANIQAVINDLNTDLENCMYADIEQEYPDIFNPPPPAQPKAQGQALSAQIVGNKVTGMYDETTTPSYNGLLKKAADEFENEYQRDSFRNHGTGLRLKPNATFKNFQPKFRGPF